MATTGIAYVTARYDPIRGCIPVSAGCRNCWAARDAIRRAKPGEQCHGLVKSTSSGPKWTGEVRLIEKDLDAPLRWRKPQRVATVFSGDWCHPSVPDEWRDRMLAVEALCPDHTFLHLTKRAAEQRATLTRHYLPGAVNDQIVFMRDREYRRRGAVFPKGRAFPRYVEEWPLLNAWFGVSVEDRQALGRIDELRATPAAYRWLSIEPLLEDLGPIDLKGIDWVVIGGESGPGARPCDLAWLRSVVAQCRLAELPCYVKQMGRWILGDHTGFRVDHWLLDDGRGFVPPIIGPHAHTRPAHAIGFSLWDRKGADRAEWPPYLRIQEVPW